MKMSSQEHNVSYTPFHSESSPVDSDVVLNDKQSPTLTCSTSLLSQVYERVQEYPHSPTLSHPGVIEPTVSEPVMFPSDMPAPILTETDPDVFNWPKHRPLLQMDPIGSPCTTPPLPCAFKEETPSLLDMDRRQSWASTWLLYQQQAQRQSADHTSLRMRDLYVDSTCPEPRPVSIHSHTSYTSNSSFNMYYCDDDDEEEEEDQASDAGTFIIAEQDHVSQADSMEPIVDMNGDAKEPVVTSQIYASQYRIQLLMEILAFQRRKWERECRNGREIKTRLHHDETSQPSTPLEKRLLKMCQTLDELHSSEQHYSHGLSRVDDIHACLERLVDSRAAKDLEPIVNMLERLKEIHRLRILPTIESLWHHVETLKEASCAQMDLMDVVQLLVQHLPDLSRELMDYKEYFSLYYVVNATFDTLDKNASGTQTVTTPVSSTDSSNTHHLSHLASRLKDKMSKKKSTGKTRDNHLLRILSFRRPSINPIISPPFSVAPAQSELPRRVSSLNLSQATAPLSRDVLPRVSSLCTLSGSNPASPHRQYHQHRQMRMSIKELKFQLSTIAVLPFQRLVRYKAILERILFLASHPIPESACTLSRRPTLFTKPDLLPFEKAPLCDLLLQCANLRALIQECNACMTSSQSADSVQQPPSSEDYERTLPLERSQSLSILQHSSLSRSLISDSTTLLSPSHTVTRVSSLGKEVETSWGSPETPMSMSMTSLSSVPSPAETEEAASPPMPTKLSKLKRSISRFFSKDHDTVEGESDVVEEDFILVEP